MSDTEEESSSSSQESDHEMMCATAMMLCDQHRAAARAISIAIPIIFCDDRHAEEQIDSFTCKWAILLFLSQ